MATLEIHKKSAKVWQHIPSDIDAFIVSKFYAKTNGDIFKIVEDSGSNRREYLFSDITVYDDTDASTPETFVSATDLMLRLEELKYVGFNRDGNIPDFTVSGAVREEFTWTSGTQVFTLSQNFDSILSIEVSGQGALSTDQYDVLAPNQFEILDTLDSGDYIVAIYNKEGSAVPVPPSTQVNSDWNATSGVAQILNKPDLYTKSETDDLLDNKVDKVIGKELSDNNFTDALKVSYDSVVANFGSKEDVSNKQDSLAVDGTGVKFPTVDATNVGDAATLVSANAYSDSLVTSIFRPAGNWDASGNSFPTTGTGTAGAIRIGDTYNTTVSGTPIGFVLLDVNDKFYALVNAPGQTASNWAKFEYNTEQATEVFRGTAKIVTQVIIEDIATTNDTDIVTAKKFWLGITKFLTLAWTWSLKQTFTTAPRLSSATASQYLKVDVNKDIESVATIPYSDITGTPVNPVTGTGTTNKVAKWTGTSTQGDSIIFDDGTEVGIGTVTPVGKLNVNTGLTGVTFDIVNQENGTVSFNNVSSATAPCITGKSDNNIGLSIFAATNNTNASPDMAFNVRENDNTDFSTLTTTAFRFSRFGTTLIDILRNGITTFAGTIKPKTGVAAADGAPIKFTTGVASQTTKEAGALNYDGSNLTLSDATYAYTLSKALLGSATLDFQSTASQSSSDLTITVTGASDGDAVLLGVPNGSVVSNSSYSAWVSSANTVTVRFTNPTLISKDPASGTFNVRVIK